MKKLRIATLAVTATFILSGCAYRAGYNPTYIPDKSSQYICAAAVLLYIEDEQEDFVYSGSPASFTGGATTLTIPIGTILKEVAEDVLENNFSGAIAFANSMNDLRQCEIVYNPKIVHFDYRYNQLRNLFFAITPEIDLTLQVKIYNQDRENIFQRKYNTDGYVSGHTFVISGSPAEEVNEILHETLYDLLDESLHDASSSILLNM